MKFTFDISKCDMIFDELRKNGYIKTSHALSPLEELKLQPFCKCHNSFNILMRLMIVMFSVDRSNRF